MVTHLITKVVEEPHSPRCSKWLCEKKVMPPSKTNDTNSVTRQNSIDLHQTQETDNLIYWFIRSDSGSTNHIWQKIGLTADHWGAVEKNATQQKHWAIQLEKNIAEAEVKKLYLQKQKHDVIQSAVQRARMANHKLNKIQWLEKAGLLTSTLHDPHITKVLNRWMPTGHATATQNSSALQSTSTPGVKGTSAPPDRLQSVEAEITSVYHSGDSNGDPIMSMICAALNNNKDMNLEDSIIVKMKLNISSPEEYSGSSDL